MGIRIESTTVAGNANGNTADSETKTHKLLKLYLFLLLKGGPVLLHSC